MLITPNLSLPFIDLNEAQREVVHNEAIRSLDVLVQLVVLDRDRTAPPGTPDEGDRYIVHAGPTGAWSGHANDITAWQDGAWRFFAPQVGWLAYVTDEGALVAWSGTAWVDALTMLTSLQNMTLLGVGTTADATNPFSAKLNNALWVARTVAEGGDGHLRYKLSKETAAKTLSLLMQTNFSGRAEIGLIGDDNLRIKVSSDGSSWLDAIVIDRTSGKVTFSQGLTVPAAPIEALASNGLQLNGDHILSQEHGDSAVAGIGSTGGVNTYITDGHTVRARGDLRVSSQRATATPPDGFKYYRRTTITTDDATLGSDDQLALEHAVEGLNLCRLRLGLASAVPISFMRMVRTSVAGLIVSSYLTNSARNRSILHQHAALAANTWTALSWTFSGDQSGTWLTDTGVGVRLGLSLAAGANLQGTADTWAGAEKIGTAAQSNLAATNGATFDDTGLIILPGVELPTAERLPLIMRSATQTEWESYRYFWRPLAGVSGERAGTGYATTATDALLLVETPRPMRTSPSFSTAAIGNWSIGFAGGASTCTALSAGTLFGLQKALIAASVGSGLTAGQIVQLRAVNSSADLAFNARL